ncbi:MAG TPA: hypothetical protein DIW31_06255 [Bacteroidales bacterium]|nr:hypothetical protein [Bacteroidales bacterium]
MKKQNLIFRIFSIFLILVLIIGFNSCKKENENGNEDVHIYDGTWLGKTDQDEKIKFMISKSSVVYLEVEYLDFNRRVTWTLNPSNCNISKGRFFCDFGYNSLGCNFTSKNYAKGVYRFNNDPRFPAHLNGTWTASKKTFSY